MDFSLNYVWIQATRLPLPNKNSTPLCPIPASLISNIENMARTYNEAAINIWVDIYGFGAHSTSITDNLNKKFAHPNITVHTLECIPEYKNSIFRENHTNFEDEASPIWKQVDLARLYILKERLTNGNENFALYSDLDIILEDRALKILKEKGIFISKEDYLVENQMIGFSKQNLPFLVQKLIPQTLTAIENDMNGWDGCVQAFKQQGHVYDAPGLSTTMRKIPNAKAVKRSYQNL